MKKIIFILAFLLSGCSGYTVVSLTTNIATYSATGKTNSDHVMSLVTGKDCKVFRALKEKKICSENTLVIAENSDDKKIVQNKNDQIALIDENIINQKEQEEIKYRNTYGEEVKEKEYVRIAKIAFEKVYFGSLTWAEGQLSRGASITDEVGLTDNLSIRIKEKFENYFY